MTALADRLILVADRVALADKWLDRGNVDQAREALAGVHSDLVDIAEEVDS